MNGHDPRLETVDCSVPWQAAKEHLEHLSGLSLGQGSVLWLPIGSCHPSSSFQLYFEDFKFCFALLLFPNLKPSCAGICKSGKKMAI
jgi:hypothetical protein